MLENTLPERENTHVNVQSCPSNPEKEIKMLDLHSSISNHKVKYKNVFGPLLNTSKHDMQRT